MKSEEGDTKAEEKTEAAVLDTEDPNYDSDDVDFEPEAILDCKIENGKRFYLVKWVGHSARSNSWEPKPFLYWAKKMIAEFHVNNPDKP